MTMARNKEALFLTITEDVRNRHYLNVGTLLAGIGIECYVGKRLIQGNSKNPYPKTEQII